ncbi:MAG: oxygenase MpaB family protein, partial [Actinomycetota bacterium]
MPPTAPTRLSRVAGLCSAGSQDDDLAGFFGPGSLAWRVNRESCCLLAGRRAMLLQLAHPLVAAGVAAHSSFRHSPVKRLVRTLDLTQTIVFGTRRQALEAAARIRSAHRGVHGRLGRAMGCYPAGTRYNAHDPGAAAWVLATLVDSAIAAHRWFARPLAPQDQDAYLRDMKRFGEFVGVPYRALP